MYTVAFEAAANRIVIRVRGFWSPGDVTPFAAAIGASVQQAIKSSNDFDVLVESLDFPVQANNVADMLANILPGGLTQTSGRVAVVVGSQLNRLQAERTLAHPRVKVFLSVAAGEAWLAGRS